MLDLVLAFIPGEWLAAIGVAVAALAAVWFGGRKSAKADAKEQAGQDYIDTRRRMDDAEADLGDDPHSARRWLSERGKSGGDL